jgi:hypothetical protein
MYNMSTLYNVGLENRELFELRQLGPVSHALQAHFTNITAPHLAHGGHKRYLQSRFLFIPLNDVPVSYCKYCHCSRNIMF